MDAMTKVVGEGSGEGVVSQNLPRVKITVLTPVLPTGSVADMVRL